MFLPLEIIWQPLKDGIFQFKEDITDTYLSLELRIKEVKHLDIVRGACFVHSSF